MTGSDGDLFSTGAGLDALLNISTGDQETFIGRELDGYKITGFIAEGGMSRVYRAARTDGSFERDVAIKLSPISGFSPAMRERFMQEQTVLAGLNHPHISQLYDARITAEGWPYIVMELVEGKAITQLCHEQRLSLTERIDLLIGVVDAVAFAHGNLVVHRDIKPSNVLVTHDGNVKLLDFGIAKLLEDESNDLTKTAAMTPQYASPEQLLGKPISVASDIFQLGLLLAEVLGGELPTAGETFTDAIQRSADGRPLTLPQGMRQTLPREITAIIEQCLRTEPADRYRDANTLRLDLEAYLSGYPVSAVGQQSGYRLRKFVQRNRGGVLGASLSLLALVSATFITAWQMVEAKQQRDAALYQQQRVQASNEFYSLLMEEMGNGAFTSVELLDRGKNLLENQFGTNQPFMATVLFDVSKRYASLGERTQERELLNEAERIAREHADNSVLAAVLCKQARNNLAQAPERAAAQLAEGYAIYNSLAAPSIDVSIDCLRAKSSSEVRQGQHEKSLATLFHAKSLLDAHPSPGTNLRGVILNDIALHYYTDAKPNESIKYLNHVLDLLEANGRSATLGYQRVAANKAVVLQNLGRMPEALEAFADLEQRMRASGFEGRGAASLLAQYADLLMSAGEVEEAHSIYTEGLRLAERDGNRRASAFLKVGLAKVSLANEAFEETMQHLDAAQTYIDKDESADLMLAMRIRVMRVKTLRNAGDLDTAVRQVDALLADTGYPHARETPGMVSALIEAAEVYRRRQEYTTALNLVSGLLARLQEHSRDASQANSYLGRAFVQRAEILLESGDPEGAKADLEAALPHLEGTLGKNHRETLAARSLLVSTQLPAPGSNLESPSI